MTGDGIRRPLTVNRRRGQRPGEAKLQAAVAGYRRYVPSETKTLVELTIPFAAAVKAGDVARLLMDQVARQGHGEDEALSTPILSMLRATRMA